MLLLHLFQLRFENVRDFFAAHADLLRVETLGQGFRDAVARDPKAERFIFVGLNRKFHGGSPSLSFFEQDADLFAVGVFGVVDFAGLARGGTFHGFFVIDAFREVVAGDVDGDVVRAGHDFHDFKGQVHPVIDTVSGDADFKIEILVHGGLILSLLLCDKSGACPRFPPSILPNSEDINKEPSLHEDSASIPGDPVADQGDDVLVALGGSHEIVGHDLSHVVSLGGEFFAMAVDAVLFFEFLLAEKVEFHGFRPFNF